jgi:YggT family protein
MLALISDLIFLYIVILIARIILSYFPINPWSPMAKVSRFVASVTDPVLNPIRRVVPPIRTGGY